MAVSTAARGSVRVQAWFVKADVTDFPSDTWLYVVCMCVYACVNRCLVYICTWRPEGNFRHHPHVPSTFVFFETGSHLPVTYQVGKAGEPVFPGICFPFLHMASCPACLCVCVRWGWGSGNLTWVLILTKQALYQLICSSSLALLFMITDPFREQKEIIISSGICCLVLNS